MAATVASGLVPIAAGSTAPDFRLPASDGEARSLESFAGTPVVLAFFKMGCGTCQATFGVFGSLEQRFRSAAPVVAVAQDAMQPAQAWLAERGFDGLVLNDSYGGYAVSASYGVDTVPTLVLVSADGIVDTVTEGWSREAANGLAARLSELTGGAGGDAPLSTPADGLPPFKPG